jgi:arsenate reductase
MKKIYHLSSCSTCQRIIKELDIDSNFELQDIKTQKITEVQLEEMKDLSGSYESLFSRRAMKYKELGLKEKVLSEDDYRDYILSEYTFLKRPVLLIDGEIFVGNAKKTVENAKKALGK